MFYLILCHIALDYRPCFRYIDIALDRYTGTVPVLCVRIKEKSVIQQIVYIPV
jgi:hypothetical protein